MNKKQSNFSIKKDSKEDEPLMHLRGSFIRNLPILIDLLICALLLGGFWRFIYLLYEFMYKLNK